MKTIILILALLFPAFFAGAQITGATLQASGLTCSMCNKATQEALSTLAFVKQITPDLNTNSFLISFKEGVPVDIDALKSKVEASGFSVARLVLTLDFHQQSISDNAHINYEGRIFQFVHVSPQVLDGPRNVVVIDRGFIPTKDFKQNLSTIQMDCYKTGRVSGSCCKVDGKTSSDRVFHVTI